ncbi:cytochrome c3 family protein [Ferrimonas balearica]|uniref:cytochrome c3 family protein n=1 Tax=Ferrimonas balearica TaxID=44012 RepID=UPI001C95BB35|nr:cytochrome c3 family protein [Ferrimonas balearica]MBY6226183.1 cytochrome c family protein [Ferrimonas balearica]
MMMKLQTQWFSAAVLTATLTACGSDSDSNPTPPTNPDPNPPVVELPDNVFGRPTGKELELYSNIRFAIAERELTDTEKAQPETRGNPYHGEYGSIYANDFKYILEPIQVSLEGIQLDSIRDDVFVEGRGSFLDLLLHVADQYNIDVEYQWDEELQTHWITSINGHTGLPEAVDQDNLGKTQGAGWKMLVGIDIWEYEKDTQGNTTKFMYKEEEIYHRMDEFPVKNDMSVIFVQAQPGEMEIRRAKYRAEIERRKANGGKLIIPEIVIDFDPETRAIFNDIEVKPHNLRPDIYQKDVLTELDAWLSLVEQKPGLKIQWSYWPKLSTNANVQGYVATAIEFNGIDDAGSVINQRYTNNGACGFVHHTGERENYHDSGMQHGLYKSVMCSNRTDMGDDWSKEQCMKEFFAKDYGPGERFDGHRPKGTGYMQGYTPFGGNDPHLTGDAMVLHNVEYINYLGAAFGSSYSADDKTAPSGCDTDARDMIDLSGVIDISKAKAPLTESHFGWKQPNCGTCHNADNSHVVEDMAPWQCAECHANNGAPDSHGEVMTCGFCHAKDLEGHGDAYSNRADYFGVETDYKEPESCLTCHVDVVNQ